MSQSQALFHYLKKNLIKYYIYSTDSTYYKNLIKRMKDWRKVKCKSYLFKYMKFQIRENSVSSNIVTVEKERETDRH